VHVRSARSGWKHCVDCDRKSPAKAKEEKNNIIMYVDCDKKIPGLKEKEEKQQQSAKFSIPSPVVAVSSKEETTVHTPTRMRTRTRKCVRHEQTMGY